MTTASSVEMARVDSLSIELFPLLVPTLVGEVGLLGDSLAILAQVPIGEPTEFAYAIRAGFGGGAAAGFDALHIATPAEPEFLYLRDAADEAVQPDSARTDAAGLTLYLPEADSRRRDLADRPQDRALYGLGPVARRGFQPRQ